MHPSAPPPGLISDLRRYLSPRDLQGPLMLAGVALALVAVNSGLAPLYERLLTARLEIRLDSAAYGKTVLLWINEGLMTLFFLLVGLEIKHEAVAGSLRHVRQILLPGAAALAGAMLPAAIYVAWNAHDPLALRGWAIPTATDIAFSLAVLGLFGDRVPRALSAFLMALAVFDDLLAILIIAIFYTGEISWLAHVLAGLVTLILILLNRLRVTALGPYLVVGVLLWLCVLKSGIHATISGVVVGLTIPYRGRTPEEPSPLEKAEHALHPWVGLLVLPAFAFANSGIPLANLFGGDLVQPVALGVGLGLLVGKTVGVFGASWAMVRSGLCSLPQGTTMRMLLGAGALAGIGFTMSMFLGTLAFEEGGTHLANTMRLGVLGGSLLSGCLGVAILARALPRRAENT